MARCHGLRMNVGGPVAEIECDAVIAATRSEIDEEIIVRVARARPPVKVNDAVAATPRQHIEHRGDFRQGKAKHGTLLQELLLVFEHERGGDIRLPPRIAERGEKPEGRPAPRPQCAEKNVRVDDDLQRRHGSRLRAEP